MVFSSTHVYVYILIVHASLLLTGIWGRCPSLVNQFTGGKLHCIPERYGQVCQLECNAGYLYPPEMGGKDMFICNTTTDTWMPDITPHCIEINECESSPCMYGASCEDQIARFFCHCAVGYTGVNCESEIYDCSLHSCVNNGTCQAVNATHYSCRCEAPFEGGYCSQIAGVWGDWSPWSSCTSTCGFGTEKRKRNCLLPPGAPSGDPGTQQVCRGTPEEERSCFKNISCQPETTSTNPDITTPHTGGASTGQPISTHIAVLSAGIVLVIAALVVTIVVCFKWRQIKKKKVPTATRR